MEIWERLKYKGGRKQPVFHLVCCDEFAELLKRVEQEHFGDYRGRQRAQVVNALLRVMEPFLLRHLSLPPERWDFSLEAGAVPVTDEREGRGVFMADELWLLLDCRIYSLLKKVHEAGVKGEEGLRSGTFSMALVLRGLLLRVFGLLDLLGRDGLVRWVEEWVKKHEADALRSRVGWKHLKHHMGFLLTEKVKYLGLYSESYRHIDFYHPPPGRKTT